MNCKKVPSQKGRFTATGAPEINPKIFPVFPVNL